MSECTIPADGINPYAEHPGFKASSCPLRYTVTQRSAYGAVSTCGFGCEMTGGHCVPSTYCDKRRADAEQQDRMRALFETAKKGTV